MVTEDLLEVLYVLLLVTPSLFWKAVSDINQAVLNLGQWMHVVVIAKREQRVEEVHMNPSTVYLWSQVLFSFKKNNKQMYLRTRKILTGVQGPQCCTLL